MHKVVIERPRWSPGRPKFGRSANLSEELLPKHEGMRRPYVKRKAFTDLLGPLKRWLRSQVGRLWNDVYSEACAVIKPDSVVRVHIKTHLLEFVERNTFMRDGTVWCITRHRWSESNEMPVYDLDKRRHLFYVHPETGVLSEIPDKPRPLRQREQIDLRFGTVKRHLLKDRLLLKLAGLWFECRMIRFPPWCESAPFDVVFKTLLIDSHAREAYGEPFYCVRKQQLSRRQLRERGLTNSKSAADCFLAILGPHLIGRINRSNGNPLRCWLQC